MKRCHAAFVVLFVTVSPVLSAVAGNLMINGDFSNPEDPLKLWTIEYTKVNFNYSFNTKYVSLLPEYGGKKNVLKLMTNEDPPPCFPAYTHMWMVGSMADSPAIPVEPGCRYRFTLSLCANAPYHIYIMGYQWKPGLKPYDKPSLFDLRPRFKGSFDTSNDRGVGGKSWTKIVREFPDKQMSDMAMNILKDVKLISLHVYQGTKPGEVYIDDLVVEKLPDRYTGGKITGDSKGAGKTTAKPAKSDRRIASR